MKINKDYLSFMAFQMEDKKLPISEETIKAKRKEYKEIK